MDIPLNLGMWAAAALPIIVLLVLMLRFKWGASKAAPAGLATAAAVAMLLYKADASVILCESAKGAWNALSVLIVVWPAILLFEVASEAGAFAAFRVKMQKYTPNELFQIMIFGWIFPSFLQGITGFGVPVAVGAPLLAGIGVSPLWAVIIPLIGAAWGNTYGTLAVAWDALVNVTGISSDPRLVLETAMWAAGFLWIWNALAGTLICLFYGGLPALKKGLPAVAAISLIQGGGQLLLSQVNPTLACFAPCCLSMVAAFLLGRTKRYAKPWRIEESRLMSRAPARGEAGDSAKDMSIHQAFAPYYMLTLITLAVLLITPVKRFLGRFTVGLAFPETATGYGYVNAATESFSPISPLTHAGTFLLLASIFGFVFYRSRGWIESGGGGRALSRSVKKTVPSAIAVVGFIAMSKIMSGTGQTVVLAEGIAAVLQGWYSLLAPSVGMLGSFMTSSNMASNILFGGFQLTTARLLNLNPAAVLGAQTAGGAIGNTICPGNIVLGTTTAGIPGNEGAVLKKILPIAIPVAVFIGCLLLAALAAM